jgi:hypothetical protein
MRPTDLLTFGITALAASVLAGACLGQVGQRGPAGPATATWSRTYGGPVSQQGLHDVRALPGGRLAVAGSTGSFGGPTPFSWLLDLDAATGEVRAEQALSSSFGGIADGAAIAADGGALFLGRDVLDLFVKHDAWVVRTDATGAVLWSLGFTSPGAGRYFLFDAAELGDGSWIAVGTAGVFDFPPQNAWVVRLSAAGAVLWQHEYGGGIVEAARTVTPTADGGFAVAGTSSSSGAGSDDAWVLKLDAAGTVVWQRTLGGLDADQAEDIVELRDGSLGIVGSTNSLTSSGHAPWILRLDRDGALLWHRVVDGVWGDLGAAARTEDGQLVVVGRVEQSGFPTNDLWAAELSVRDGSALWQRAYEGDLGDFGSAALPLPGAGLVLGGTWGWGFPGESIWLQRTDDQGDIAGCDLVRTTSFALLRPPITVKAGTALQLHATAQLEALAVQVAPSDAQVIDICP